MLRWNDERSKLKEEINKLNEKIDQKDKKIENLVENVTILKVELKKSSEECEKQAKINAKLNQENS